MLVDVLAGVPVTTADRWLLEWLAQWDAGTVATVVELLRGARQYPSRGAR